MARIRTIKPEFFTSEDIVSLSPLARLLYIATWCEADKEGRLAWKPGTFKLRYLPADNCDVNALCDELVGGGQLVLYGDGLAYIPAFGRHQHINPRESASTLPDPSETVRKGTRAPRVATRGDASARVPHAQGGREGKGRECNTPPTPSGGVTVHDFPPGFEAFWSAYPRKTAKGAAAKAFARTRPDEAMLAQMLAAIEKQRTWPQWTKDRGEFIPHPATWLHGRRWEDQPAAPSPAPADDIFAGAR